jgi:hypothetical protein
VTLTYPSAFSSIHSVVAINGDRNQGTFWFSVIGGMGNSATTFRVSTAAGELTGTLIRYNWFAFGAV